MTIIAIGTTRGAELTRIAEMLALFYGILTQATTYIEILREHEVSLFPLPREMDPKMLSRVQIVCVDTAQASRDIATAIIAHKKKGGTIVVGLPSFAQHLSDDLLRLIDIFLIAAIPADPSVADTLRIFSEVRDRVGGPHTWILGAGCAGGAAIAARLRAAAASLLARNAQAPLKSEDLPILNWGMPLWHWATWDQLSSFGAENNTDSEPPRHVMRACNTLFRQTVLLSQHPDRAPTFDELAEDSPTFFEPWLLDDTRTQAQKLLDLAEDLSLIETGAGPIPEDLSHAAHLDEWGLTKRTFTALEGTVSDHPEQPTGDWVTTSELMTFGPDRAWARTVSRYYTLSAPVEVLPSSMQDR